MTFDESAHARGTGAQGGQFVVTTGGKTAPARKAAPVRAAKKAAPGKKAAKKAAPGGGNLSFDGRRGTGYGRPGGDPRVKGLQSALNKLGLTDGSGKKLAEDGKLGPKTTAAVKRAQRALGLKPDGVVTPAVLRQLTAAKSAKDLKKAPAKKVAAKKAAPAKKAAAGAKKVTPAKAPARKVTHA